MRHHGAMPVCLAFLLALFVPSSHAGLTVEMSFDGSQVTTGSLLAQVCATSGVPLACDDALKDIALRVYGSGPAYRLLGSLEWITGGQWRLEQPGWLLVGPANRPVVTAIARRLTPELLAVASGSASRAQRLILSTAAEFAQSVSGTAEGAVPWHWRTLTGEQQALLVRLCLANVARQALGDVTSGPSGTPRGAVVDGCSVAWLPNVSGYETVEVRWPGMTTLTWAKDGKPLRTRVRAENVFGTAVTVDIRDGLLPELAARLTPPLDSVIMLGETPDGRASLSVEQVSAHQVLLRVQDTWGVPYRGDPGLHTATLGERPLALLLDGVPESDPATPIALQRMLTEARAALVREGRPETQSWTSLRAEQVQAWYAQMLEGLAKRLSAPQREVLAREGCLPVEMLSTEQKEWLHAVLDLRWRQVAWAQLWELRRMAEVDKLSGEASATRLTIGHPQSKQPAVIEVPQE